MPQRFRLSALFYFLYFFEGAPIGLIWWTIPTILSLQGFSVETITTLSASATLPWSCKFLLAPFVDRFVYRRRDYAWTIALLQVGMLAGLVGLLFISMASPAVLKVVLLISFFSAAQDVVIDAWAIASVPSSERGRINGAMQAGMLTGRWAFGAGLLVFLSYISLNSALKFLSALVIASILFLLIYYRNNKEAIAPVVKKLNYRALRFVFERKFILLGLIALLSGFALEGFTTVVSPFLVENGFEQEAVGWTLSATIGFMLLGSVTGGFVADKLGDLKSFFGIGLVLAAMVSLLGGLMGAPAQLIVLGVLASYFLVGMFVAASYTYFMNQCEGEMEATRFTFLMAVTNLCEVVAAFSIGKLIVWNDLGYAGGFVICAAISLLGLVLLLLSKTSSDVSADKNLSKKWAGEAAQS